MALCLLRSTEEEGRAGGGQNKCGSLIRNHAAAERHHVPLHAREDRLSPSAAVIVPAARWGRRPISSRCGPFRQRRYAALVALKMRGRLGGLAFRK
jgi:hypothetical protein